MPIAPRQLLITGGSVVNVFSGEIYPADVLCAGGRIADLQPAGRLPQPCDCATVDARGRFVLPGLINAHLHIESSMVTPAEYAKAVVPRGTLTLVADPHEIANVEGVGGIRRMVASAERAIADIYYVAPSCVPATHLETAGGELGPAEVSGLLAEPYILGLGEVMNYPGVLAGDPDVLAKMAAARRAGKPIDGHAPGLAGRDLARYVLAGVTSEHEATSLAEAREKWRLGLWLMIRQGSAARNLADLLPLAIESGGERMMLVTDDRHPDDLVAAGELDDVLRQAVAGGLPPVAAIRMATWNPALYFHLDDRGAVLPGKLADLWIVEDLREFRTAAVIKRGEIVWSDGQWTAGLPGPAATDAGDTAGSVHLPADLGTRLAMPARQGTARVIGIVPGQITTEHRRWEVAVGADGTVSSRDGEVCRLAVIERHGRNGNVGIGFVSGLGLGAAPARAVAIGATVAHDSHNLVIAGTSEAAMRQVAEALAKAGGGFAVVADGTLTGLLALPVAGLMADRAVEAVAAGTALVNQAARAAGAVGESPLMTLSFLALPVIPALKLTDRGLVDVARFEHVPLWIEQGKGD